MAALALAPASKTQLDPYGNDVAVDPLNPTAKKPTLSLATSTAAPPTGGVVPLAQGAQPYASTVDSTSPEGNLLGKTIQPGPAVDRVALATNAWDTFAKSTDPQYAADLRLATQSAAGKGQIGSGGLRTTYGNLANQRNLQLDTARNTLLNDAVSGSIADAYKNIDIATQQQGVQGAAQQTAYAQALANAEHTLAAEIGKGNLAVSQQQADTSRLGTTGSLAIQQSGLDLAKGEATGTIGGTQTLSAQALDLQRKQADIDAAYKAGTLTLAEKNQALAELAQAQSNTLETGKLDLAKTAQATAAGQTQQQIDLAKLAQTQNVDLAQKGLDINKMSAETAQKAQAAMEAYQAGTLSLSGRDQALKELANTQQYGIAGDQLQLAKTGQAADIAAKQRELDLQQKAQDIDAQYKAGTLTLAEKNQALAELAQSQSNTLEAGKLSLAQSTAGAQLAQEQQKIDLAKITQSQSVDLAKLGLDINKMSAETAQKAQAAMESYQNGEITLGNRDAALKELAQSQSNTLATNQLTLAQKTEGAQESQFTAAQAQQQNQFIDQLVGGAAVMGPDGVRWVDSIQNRQLQLAELAQSQSNTLDQGKLSLAKDQLAEASKQFGLSLAQSKELATIADQTANRQIDVAQTQGQNALLVQLAQVLGGPDGKVDPKLLDAVLASLGVAMGSDGTRAVDPHVSHGDPYGDTTGKYGDAKTKSGV